MSYLSDGTIVPTYLNVSGNSHTGNLKNNVTYDPFIKLGTIIAINYPENKNSSINYVTYDVEVNSWNHGICNSIILHNCRAIDLLGGKADYLKPKYRVKKDPKKYTEKDENDIDPASRVLVVGINGNLRDAIIIGGVVNPASKKDLDKTHNFQFEFNGCNLAINENGEITVIRKGATNDDGTIKDDQKGGAKVFIDKEGNILISSTKENQIFINDTDDKIEIGAKDKSSNENLVLGKTYRDKESSMNDSLKSTLSNIKSTIQDMTQQFIQAYIALNLPLFNAAGPAAATAMQTLSQDCMKLAMQFDDMKSAIEKFESSKDDYLSKKCFTE